MLLHRISPQHTLRHRQTFVSANSGFWRFFAEFTFISCAVLTALTVVASTGCGETPTSTPTLTPTSFSVAVTATPRFNGEPVQAPNASAGATFKYPARGNLITLDPAVGSTTAARVLHYEIYSGLMKIVDDPAQPFEPDLAARYDVSDGGLRYEFVLRKGLKFSDGSEVTAADFKWSWERALKPDTGSDIAREVFGSIQGAPDVMSGTTEELAGVQAIDDRTLRVVLESPDNQFLALLAKPVAAVLRRSNVETWGVNWADWQTSSTIRSYSFDLETLPVGTGPFRLAEFEFLGNVKIVRNDYYHEGTPDLGAVIFVTGISRIGDADPLLSQAEAFEFGNIDTITVDNDGLSWFQSSFPDSQGVATSADVRPVTTITVLNSEYGAFQDVAFRRSLVHALDVDSIAAKLGRLRATSLVPTELAVTVPSATALGFGPEKAQELLASTEANSNDVSVMFYTWFDNDFEDEFKLMAVDWESILGVKANHRKVAVDHYNVLLDNGEIQMNVVSIAPDYPGRGSIVDGIDLTFGGKVALTGDALRATQMIEEARSTPDPVVRERKFLEAEQFLIDYALAVPLFRYSYPLNVIVQPWVHNYRIPKYGGSRFKDVFFDHSAPKR